MSQNPKESKANEEFINKYREALTQAEILANTNRYANLPRSMVDGFELSFIMAYTKDEKAGKTALLIMLNAVYLLGYRAAVDQLANLDIDKDIVIKNDDSTGSTRKSS